MPTPRRPSRIVKTVPKITTPKVTLKEKLEKVSANVGPRTTADSHLVVSALAGTGTTITITALASTSTC